MIVLETRRLVLRHLTLDDAAFILGLLNQPSFLRHIGDRGVRSLADARRYLASGPLASYAEHGFGLWAVERREDSEPVGICGLLRRPGLSYPDVGFALLPEFWRRGYAFEAAEATLAHGYRALGLERIVAITSPDNEASMRLLEKLGMRLEERVRLEEDSSEVCLFGPASQD